MSNISQTQTNLITGAAAGVDIISNTLTHTPPSGSRGWKYLIVSVECVVNDITDNGSLPSTNIETVTLSAGTLVSANGLFTSVHLGSGTVVLVRG